MEHFQDGPAMGGTPHANTLDYLPKKHGKFKWPHVSHERIHMRTTHLYTPWMNQSVKVTSVHWSIMVHLTSISSNYIHGIASIIETDQKDI
jgi:hypothetical protein